MKRILIHDLNKYIGEEVYLMGWVKKIRKLGKVSFIIVRDRTGQVQTVFEGENLPEGITKESVVRMTGVVRKESRVKEGYEVNLYPDGIEVVSRAHTPLPFEIKKADKEINPDNVYNHRAISLRNEKLSAVFTVQAEIMKSYREFLNSEGFTEVSTPKIVAAGTEGGTELFEIKYFDKKAYLAQSPQFYKQMMVGAGYERVFETGKAYRAEKHDTSRHINEYISLDLEMGFIDSYEGLMEIESRLLHYIMDQLKANCKKIINEFKIKIPFVPEKIPAITFVEACQVLKEEFNKDTKKNNLDPDGEELLSRWAREEYGSEWLFITKFPSEKRPFYTMDDPEDKRLTESFDLLLRGIEVTTGGQRIHLYEQLREKMIWFNLNPSDYQSYLDVFKYGMPPHGGLAIGLERLTMKICNLTNIREASLFPRDRKRLVP